MSTWTTPITWTSGQTVTAAQMNAEVRDHLNFLKGFADLITDSTTADTGTSTYLQITKANSIAPILYGEVSGDAHPMTKVTPSYIAWGPGTATYDISLQRTTTRRLEIAYDGVDSPQLGVETKDSPGAHNALFVWAASDTNPRVALGTDASHNPRISFGAGTAVVDLHLTRDAAGRLMFEAPDLTSAIRIGSNLGTQTGEVFSFFSWREGDTQPRAALGQDSSGNPALFFGPGSSTAPDVKLHRTGTGVLEFTLTNIVVNGYTRGIRATASGGVFLGRASGDGSDNFTLYASGRGVFNDGIQTLVVANTVDDTDFAFTPQSGTIGVDTASNAGAGRIYVRVGSTWRYVNLT